MRWTRAKVATLCGRCHRQMRVGDALLVIGVGAGGKIEKVRCESCVGPAPPDLPTTMAVREARAPIDMTRIGLLPLNWTREPGEEG
jgi:hypothetical protein